MYLFMLIVPILFEAAKNQEINHIIYCQNVNCRNFAERILLNQNLLNAMKIKFSPVVYKNIEIFNESLHKS